MHDEQKNINPWADKLDELPLSDMQEAWNGMEAALNSEMPVKQEKDWRRWVILIILLLLLIGVCNCPGYLRMGKNIAKKDSTAKQKGNLEGSNTSRTSSTTKENDQSAGGSSFLPLDETDSKQANTQVAKQPDQSINDSSETKESNDVIPSRSEEATSSTGKQNINDAKGTGSKINTGTTGKKPNANIVTGSARTNNDVTGLSKRKTNQRRIVANNKTGSGFLSSRISNGSKNNKAIAKKSGPPISIKKNDRITQGEDNNIATADSVQKNDNNILEKISATDSTTQATAIDTIGKKDSTTVSNKPAPLDPAVAKKKQSKDSTSEKGFAVAVGLNHIVPIGDQQSSNFNSGGTTGSWKDYIPVPQLRYHFNKKLYLQLEAQFNAPQYTKSLLAKQTTSTDTMPGVPRQQSSVTIKKLFYLNIPLSVHYSPFKNFYVGTGLQYSRLSNAVGLLESKAIRSGSPDSLQSAKTQSIKSDSTYQLLSTSEWRLLFDANYHWRKFIVGVRYNYALSNFINVQVSSTQLTQARNSSLQFYLRYTLWDQRRKKSKTAK